MIPTEAELLLARAAELRAMASEGNALAQKLSAHTEMSGDEAADFLSNLGPLDQAKMREIREELKTLTPEQQLEFWRQATEMICSKKDDIQ